MLFLVTLLVAGVVIELEEEVEEEEGVEEDEEEEDGATNPILQSSLGCAFRLLSNTTKKQMMRE
jgi:hypothetical protein